MINILFVFCLNLNCFSSQLLKLSLQLLVKSSELILNFKPALFTNSHKMVVRVIARKSNYKLKVNHFIYLFLQYLKSNVSKNSDSSCFGIFSFWGILPSLPCCCPFTLFQYMYCQSKLLFCYMKRFFGYSLTFLPKDIFHNYSSVITSAPTTIAATILPQCDHYHYFYCYYHVFHFDQYHHQCYIHHTAVTATITTTLAIGITFCYRVAFLCLIGRLPVNYFRFLF